MADILYTLIIFPIELILDLCYVFAFRITENHGLSIIGLSILVSVLILPLYFTAEKWQHEEREKQKLMKPMKDNINAVFKGDKRYMLLSTLYRQHNYHPVYALRNSLSLLIQIPFFIAAYHFLIHLNALTGFKFYFISDLASPDKLLNIFGGVNLLPVIMTLINVVSGFIYTKGLEIKDKIQVYGIAAVFLVLLYNSPSALVLYWTCNNIFSLIKNFIQSRKNPKKITIILIAVFCSILNIYLLFIHSGWIIKRLLLVFILTLIPFIPLLFKIIQTKTQIINIIRKYPEKSRSDSVFYLSIIILFILAGFIIPSSLIASSVQEFSFIENYNSPFPFIINTMLQSFGIFIIWPLCIYHIFSKQIKQILSTAMCGLAFASILNVFLFSGDYGFMTLLFTFSKSINSSTLNILINLTAVLLTFIIIFISAYRFKKILFSLLTVSLFSLVILGGISNINIHNNYKLFEKQLQGNKEISGDVSFQFSKNGKNVLIIMLDRAYSGFIPYIFDEKPELYNSFDGFTWFRNTVSFGQHTLIGVPGIYGGYEYTPLEMQKRKNINIVEKHNEALLLLPRIFLENDFEVTVTDPPHANFRWIPDLSIFSDYPRINVDNIERKYNSLWLTNKDNLSNIKITDIINFHLIRLSFFKFSPLIFRNFIYDFGDWLTVRNIKFPKSTMDNYIALDVLPDISIINENNKNNFNSICNNLTHSAYFLQTPDYILTNNITNELRGNFTDSRDYHVNAAALLLLGKYFKFLQDNDVYNNTRIIIVSDHGIAPPDDFPGNLFSINGECLNLFFSFLLVKDFNQIGTLSVNDSFMTNADVPLIALSDFIENPVNPFTGSSIIDYKENVNNGGVTVTFGGSPKDIEKRSAHTFSITQDQWLHVHSNIYNPVNWSIININEKN